MAFHRLRRRNLSANSARAVGRSLISVQRIWRAHKLQPHRVRTFKRSRDPDFAAKLTDIVGLYMDPPTQAAVLSIDEKSVSVAPGPFFRGVRAYDGVA